MAVSGAVSSAIAGISLSGGKTYNLSDVGAVNATQEYTDIDYSNIDMPTNFDEYTIITDQLAKDENFINKIIEKVRQILDSLNYDKTDLVIENSELFIPTFIRICDYSEELQKNKTIEEYTNGVDEKIVNFIVENRDLLSSKELEGSEDTLIVEIAFETLTDLSYGKTFNEIFAENLETETTDNSKSFFRRNMRRFINGICANYDDDKSRSMTERFLSLYGDDALRVGHTVSTTIFDNIPFFSEMFATIFKGGIGDLLMQGGKIGTKTGLKSLLKKFFVNGMVTNVSAKFIPAAGVGVVPFLAKNLISNVSKTGFKVQGRFVGEVKSLLNGDSLWRKLFVPKNVTTVKEFAEHLASELSIKTIACKAVGTGVTSLVVGSTVSFAFEFAETLTETGDPIEALKAGGKQIVEDLPMNTSVAVGAAVGQVVGSVAGAAIGSIFGPFGALVGEKVGGFLGALVGGFVGQSVYNACETAYESSDNPEKKWYKPWTW